MRKRNVLNSPRLEELKRKRRRILRNKILVYFFIFLAVLIGLVFLSRWKKINIENVVISGNEIIDTEALDKVVRSDIAGNYLWIFPKTNFLIYPKNKIKNDLALQFKRLSNISINEKNFKTLEINVSEYEGEYTWCGDVLPPASAGGAQASLPAVGGEINNKCYFLDTNGYVFDEAPYFSGNVYLKFFGKIDRNTELATGFSFLPHTFEKVISFVDNLQKMGLKISAVFVKTDGDMELYLSSGVSLSNMPKIIFKANADFEKLAENLQAALSVEPLQSDFKKKYSSLQYIDLRFGNKVYYKFR